MTGDGVSDDTAAIQRVFDALSSPAFGVAGGLLAVPPGEYVLTDTIAIHRFAGTIQGTGIGHTPAVGTAEGLGTSFRWAGPAGRPMFRFTDSAKLAVRDLRFEGHDARPPSVALDFHAVATHQHGTNSELVVEDCRFGTWPWAHGGQDEGRLETGIRFSGANGNNDQFRIGRCEFVGRTGWSTTAGIRIDNPQSIWGSVTDCTFDKLAVGLETSASVTVVNAQFSRCGVDFALRNTAAIDVFGWQSEHSSLLASLAPTSSLRVVGGHCQINGQYLRPGSPLVDAFPSQNSTVSLRGVRFSYPGSQAYPEGIQDLPGRPAIEFGPGPGSNHPAGGCGFLIKVEDCVNLHADQCKLVGPMYASVPRSRGLVEWYSRTKDGIVQFRNELWHASAGAGTRDTLNTQVWDQPRPGTRN